MATSPEPEREIDDLWQQGGNPTLYLLTFITTRARDRAIDLDKRTVYRKGIRGGLEEVATFKREEDAKAAVFSHNLIVQEQKFEALHERLGDLINRVDSSIMGDPIL